jgi:hypothetical protein
MTDRSFIVKMQRPIETNMPEPLVLIYNQDRSYQTHASYDAETESMFNLYGLVRYGRHKMYARIHLDESEEIVIDEMLKDDQGW